MILYPNSNYLGLTPSQLFPNAWKLMLSCCKVWCRVLDFLARNTPISFLRNFYLLMVFFVLIGIYTICKGGVPEKALFTCQGLVQEILLSIKYGLGVLHGRSSLPKLSLLGNLESNVGRSWIRHGALNSKGGPPSTSLLLHQRESQSTSYQFPSHSRKCWLIFRLVIHI